MSSVGGGECPLEEGGSRRGGGGTFSTVGMARSELEALVLLERTKKARSCS